MNNEEKIEVEEKLAKQKVTKGPELNLQTTRLATIIYDPMYREFDDGSASYISLDHITFSPDGKKVAYKVTTAEIKKGLL